MRTERAQEWGLHVYNADYEGIFFQWIEGRAAILPHFTYPRNSSAASYVDDGGTAAYADSSNIAVAPCGCGFHRGNRAGEKIR